MIGAHIMGLPVEESALALVPAGAAMVTAIVVSSRARLRALRQRLRRSTR